MGSLDGESARRKAAEANTETYMPRVGFQHTIPLFLPQKTFHALDRAAAEYSWNHQKYFEHLYGKTKPIYVYHTVSYKNKPKLTRYA
jgi:hypothetical protein